MRLRIVLATLTGLLLAAAAPSIASAKPPIDVWGGEPSIRDMTMSPDGKRIAWTQKAESGDVLIERNLETGVSRALTRTTKQEMNFLQYLSDRHLLFFPYEVRGLPGERGVWRVGAAIIYDVGRDKTYNIEAFGRLLAVSVDRERVWFAEDYNIREVRLSTGNTWSSDIGAHYDEDGWIVNRDGKIIASQLLQDEHGANTLFAVEGSKRRPLVRETSKTAEIWLLGFTADPGSVVVLDRRGGTGPALRALSLADGSVGPPLFAPAGAETVTAVSDETGVIIGGLVSGPYPRYEFADPQLTAEARNLRASFPGQAVIIKDWSENQRKLLLYVEGGIEPGRYVVFDRDARKLIPIIASRPEISRADMGEMITIEYPARDGRKIPAIVTWPAGSTPEQRKNLPLIVLPHDGPERYSRIEYDWLAQFLANDGYAVLQPNYRGSSGFGTEFRTAGFDQFGRTMQHDVTDGVIALMKMGWIDSKRVCIMGQGWGGYMALMAGAITPDIYKCVISIGGITDLPDYLKFVRAGTTRYGVNYARWLELLGDAKENETNQLRYSPVNLARQFSAPVLLLHGDNDTHSPDRQSNRMEESLKASGKTARFIVVPDENQYWLRPASRLKLLSEISAFLTQHIGTPPS
jgi:dipeptidyl aminopeptidase/acylaminoacyl peptidase